MFKVSQQQLGQQAEELAMDYLQKQGLKTIERNYHSRTGEIDLIMQDNDTLVFVEVRYRHQSPWEVILGSIDRYKQIKLMKTAVFYLKKKGLYTKSRFRFDVVGINRTSPDHLDIRWIKQAFESEW